MLNYTDLKMSLLRGSSMKVDDLDIKPYTLGEIEKKGYTNYMKTLQVLFITVEDFLRGITDVQQRMELELVKNELTVFDFLIKPEIGMTDNMLQALSTILRTDDLYILDEIIAVDFFKEGILYENEDGEVVTDDELFETLKEEVKVVTRNNYDDIVKIAKYQNYLEKVDGELSRDDNPADEATKLLQEQMKKNQERVSKIKKAEKSNNSKVEKTDFSDLISAVTAKSPTINKLNVWEYTLYQFYDEYARLETIDGYEFSVKAILAGAKDVEIKHWSSRV